jgi:Cu2+-exporting ATPase
MGDSADAMDTALPSHANCFHCGLPVPSGLNLVVRIEGIDQPMCCHGCQAVAAAIVDAGLHSFYAHRVAPSRRAEDLIPAELEQLALYDRDDLQKSFVHRQSDSVREASLMLEGIVCAACVWLNERHVNALPGVIEFRVNYSTHRARLKWDNDVIPLSRVLEAIAAIGYVAHPFDPGRQEVIQRRERSAALRRLAVAGLGAMQVMMLAVALYAGDHYGMDQDIRGFLRWMSLLISLPVVLYSARVFFSAAWRDLRRHRFGMDVPVSLAIALAFCASVWATVAGTGAVYFDSVTMFTFFLLAGRFLEMGARHRVGQVSEELVRLLPEMATRIGAGETRLVPVLELEIGDWVRVRPGDTVPADGRVLEGFSSVDESLLTGESLPLRCAPGSDVVGGAVNVESPLLVEVTAVGGDTVLSSIVRLLDRAQSEKPRIAALADRIAGWFVAVVLLLAASVFGWWWVHQPADALRVTLSVLVVTCPCALSLATPAAMTAATGQLTRLGLLTTRGHALETLARATHLVLDKTGTLTYGRLRLAAIETLGRMPEEACLAIAAGLETGSEHPVGRALREASGETSAPVVRIQNTPGQGVSGELDGQWYRLGTETFARSASAVETDLDGDQAGRVWLADDTGVLARFEFDDTVREDAAAAIVQLQDLGLRVCLLSGDGPLRVERVARSVGIAESSGGLLPEDKLARVRALQRDGGVVAMVGDGINDAPVLAAAQVSIAMGSGSQLAHASADMILLSERLAHLPQGVRTARKTLAVIRQNLIWALGYNALALPLAAAGWIQPWMAAIGMSLSSLLVVLNALRLKAVPAEDIYTKDEPRRSETRTGMLG